MTNVFQFLKERVWFFAGVALCLAIGLAPTPAGLTLAGKYAIGLLVMVTIFFATETVPLGGTALLIGSYQVLLGIRSFAEVPKTFMHDAVFFILGALMVAAVLVKFNIHSRLAIVILDRVGSGLRGVILGIVGSCALLSAFMSEHAVASLMLPIGMTLITASGGARKVPGLSRLLLLSIAYGCMIGAIATPSGGTRNVVMISYIQEYANQSIGYGQWMLYVFPLTLLLIPLTAFILMRLFPSEVTSLGKAHQTLAGELKKMGKMTPREGVVLFIFLLTVLAWVFAGEVWGLGTIAILAAVAYMVGGFATWKELQDRVNWQVVILYGGAISLGLCLKDTGAAEWMALRFSDLFRVLPLGQGSLVIMGLVVLLSMVLANTMAAGPAVAVLGPIVLKIAEVFHLSPVAVGMAAAVSSSFAFLLIIGSPPSTIVYGSGLLKTTDFLRGGWVLSLVSGGILVILVVGIYWRLAGVF